MPLNFKCTESGWKVNLTWETSTELNSAYFAIENSITGSNFIEVAQINSRNSSTGAIYAYSCEKMGFSHNYFRLKTVDLNGTFSYSIVVDISVNKNHNNRNNNRLRIKVCVLSELNSNIVDIKNLKVGKNRLTLFDINGKKLTEVNATGINQSIDISMYKKGVYLLRIQNASGNNKIFKVIKE